MIKSALSVPAICLTILPIFLSGILQSYTSGATEKTGVWNPGGGRYNPESSRNHTYTFQLNADNKAIDVTLQSPDTDVALWVYDPLGVKIGFLVGGRSKTFSKSGLSAGKYKIIAGTSERAASGKYTLKVTGNDSPLLLEASQNLEASGTWGNNGGGGRYHPDSYRNHHYTVEVLEDNSSLDILLNTTIASGALWVYDPQGQKIHFSTGKFDLYPVVNAPQKGMYEIVVGTNDRGIPNASYKLNVNGKIANLKQIAAKDTCLEGKIGDGAGRYSPDSPKNQVYTLELTEANRALDIEVQSTGFQVAVWVYGPKGDKISFQVGKTAHTFVTNKANQIQQGKGAYKIVVGTTAVGESGNYTLCASGQIGNFKRL